jgi:hypothetical protein
MPITRNAQSNQSLCLINYFSGELTLDSASVGHIAAQRGLG